MSEKLATETKRALRKIPMILADYAQDVHYTLEGYYHLSELRLIIAHLRKENAKLKRIVKRNGAAPNAGKEGRRWQK